jgi:cytochrome P450
MLIACVGAPAGRRRDVSEQHSGESEKAKYDLFSPSFLADPHSVFHRMRAEDPIYWHPDLKAWIFTRYKDIVVMTRDRRLSAERVGQFVIGASEALRPKIDAIGRFIGHWLLCQDPPRHTLLRTLVAKAFSPQVVEGLRPTIQDLVDEMLDVFIDSGQMDIVQDLSFPLPAMVIGKMLGVPPHRIDDFKKWTTDVFALFGGGLATDEIIETGYRGVTALDGYFRELIAERRGALTGDLLSRLIAAEEQGAFLSEEELVSTCAMLMVGGHETTAHFIGNSVLALLQNPSEMRKLRDDPSLIEGAVEELMRHDGSVFMVSRRATEDIDFGDVTVRANDFTIAFIQAGNRDPAVFEDADRLDITRRGTKSLSFGHGIHFCIGAALARLEAEVALSTILRRLPNLDLAAETADWIPSLGLRGLATLPVTFRSRRATRLSEPPPSRRGPMSASAPLSLRAPVILPAPLASSRASRT